MKKNVIWLCFILILCSCTDENPVDSKNSENSENSEKVSPEIRSFTFAGLESKIKVTINDTNIEVIVPFYNDVTKLTPSIELSEGATISPKSGVQTDFTNVVKYNVTSNNQTTTYAVSVNKAKMQITSVDKTTVATGDTLRIKGNFAPSGNIVNFGSVSVTPPIQNDSILTVFIWDSWIGLFLGENKLTVKNNWGSVDYPEPITITAPIRKINSFKLKLENGSSIDASIDESTKTIKAILPYGVDITNIITDISISEGATVLPNSGVATDFTNSVNYVVTAKDGSTATYEATVMVTPRIQIDRVDETVLEVGDIITIHGDFPAFGNTSNVSLRTPNEIGGYTLYVLTLITESTTKLVCKSEGYFPTGEYELYIKSGVDYGNEAVYPTLITLTETTKLPQIVSLDKTEYKVGELMEITGIRFPNETAELTFRGPSHFALLGLRAVNNKITISAQTNVVGEYTISLYFIESKSYTNRMKVKIVK